MSRGRASVECEGEPWRLVAVALADMQAELVALRAAVDRLSERLVAAAPQPTSAGPPEDGGMVTTREAAKRLGVKRRWIYDNKAHLHVRKLGPGRNGRLGVPVARINELLEGAAAGGPHAEPPARPVPAYKRRRRARKGG